MTARVRNRILSLLATSVLALSADVGAAQATLPPEKLVETDHFPESFGSTHGVAANNDASSVEHGDVYVVDTSNHRVQVFTATGTFVEMFGREVDMSKPGNVCKAGEECQAGLEGSEAGQFSTPLGIASDPSSGDVFVDEFVEGAERVQSFTPEGQFLFEIGREVNATAAQKNVCTQAEIASCVAPKPPEGSAEEGVFNFETSTTPNILAAGGPKDLLFVGDENRVQEFNATTGVPAKQQISLTSIGTGQVRSLALDQTSGDVYLVYPEQASGAVHEFSEAGAELADIAIKPRSQGQEVHILGIALDPSDRLAVGERESDLNRGSLYEPTTGKRISSFTAPTSFGGMAFDDGGHLYIGEESNFSGSAQVFVYTLESIAALNLTTLPEPGCNEGVEADTLVPMVCTLSGEVNPEGVAETEAFFEYGRTTALGSKTPLEAIAATGAAQPSVSLRPNETYYYRLAGFDANVKPPEEAFTTETETFATKLVAPRIAATETLAIGTTSARLFGELNPENARTEYFFEYGQGEALANCIGLRNAGSCPGVLATPVTMSSVYGKIGAKAELGSLQSGVTYHYRLFAENENRAQTKHFEATGPEETFTTPPLPQPSAQTGGSGALTATSATISGTVNPNGLPAGYEFELGVYDGAATHYTIVASGSAGSGTEPVSEELTLTGLQPGTKYAYRILATSNSIENATHSLEGGVVTFTTQGVPAALVAPVALPPLPTPLIIFPKPVVKCKPGFVRNKHGVCARSKPRKRGKGHGRKPRKSGKRG
jgi:NHL repeat